MSHDTMTTPSADKKALAAMVEGDSRSSLDETEMTQNDDILKELEMVPSFSRPAKSISPEKYHVKRPYKSTGFMGVGTDDSEEITMEQSVILYQSTASLYISMVNANPGVNQYTQFMGQLVAIKKDGKVKYFTNRHNVANGVDKKSGDTLLCIGPHKILTAAGCLGRMEFPNTGYQQKPEDTIDLRDGATWDVGYDVVCVGTWDWSEKNSVRDERIRAFAQQHWPYDRGLAKTLQDVCSNLVPLECVGDDFVYEKGLKIGLVAIHLNGRDSDELVGGEQDQNVSHWARFLALVGGVIIWMFEAFFSLFGYGKDTVMVYTGVITGEGPDHVDYNINSKGGCSGGAVVVMDRKHKDFFKVICIHSGYSYALDKNIGMKLAGNFDRRWFMRED